MAEMGDSRQGEPFDPEDVLNLADKLSALQFARRAMGDDAVKAMLGECPDLLEAKLREKGKEARERLIKMAHS